MDSVTEEDLDEEIAELAEDLKRAEGRLKNS